MPVAMCQVGHPWSLESLVVMLESVGITPMIPSARLRSELLTAGCDTVVCPTSLAKGWGDELRCKVAESDSPIADLYIDIKAHRNGPKVLAKWPKLKGKVLWYWINGGEPSRVKGDEVTPGFPILTANQHYKGRDDSYVCWPPWNRDRDHRIRRQPCNPPVCLVHNVAGYGYGELAAAVPFVRTYGSHGNPGGILKHEHVPATLSQALCMVHMKSVDAPGYALYEALMSACPIVCSELIISRCKMHDLLEAEVTCLTYREDYKSIDVARAAGDIELAVERLKDSALNEAIGVAGASRLARHLWRDIPGFKAFLERHYALRLPG